MALLAAVLARSALFVVTALSAAWVTLCRAHTAAWLAAAAARFISVDAYAALCDASGAISEMPCRARAAKVPAMPMARDIRAGMALEEDSELKELVSSQSISMMSFLLSGEKCARIAAHSSTGVSWKYLAMVALDRGLKCSATCAASLGEPSAAGLEDSITSIDLHGCSRTAGLLLRSQVSIISGSSSSAAQADETSGSCAAFDGDEVEGYPDSTASS
mmetsp:Transcript_19808/g.41204  ORF Transcript_19808/g.41204 Transcript_19808/m.41204 type:complete len:218 (+) Transcript_19808:256-909(+)